MLDVLQVRLMEFSPNEKYAVSYSAEEPRGPREKASLTLNIFDTFSGVCLCKSLFSSSCAAACPAWCCLLHRLLPDIGAARCCVQIITKFTCH